MTKTGLPLSLSCPKNITKQQLKNASNTIVGDDVIITGPHEYVLIETYLMRIGGYRMAIFTCKFCLETTTKRIE